MKEGILKESGLRNDKPEKSKYDVMKVLEQELKKPQVPEKFKFGKDKRIENNNMLLSQYCSFFSKAGFEMD